MYNTAMDCDRAVSQGAYRQLERPNTWQERRALTDQVVNFALNHLQKLESGQIPAICMKEDEAAGLLDFAFEQAPKDIDTLLSVFDEHVLGSGIPESHAKLGGISGGGTYLAVLGDYLAAVTNRFPACFNVCPGSVRMEKMVVSWAAKLFNFPEGYSGTLTSGGSAGTILAILAARHSKGLKGEDFKRAVVYTTSMINICVRRSLMTTGLFEATIREVAMDDDFRMDPKNLRDMVKKDREDGLLPLMVIAIIGTTSLGSVDPVDQIADVAEEYNLWLHVDAAYGGFFVLVEELKDYFKGVNRADSMILDPHKTLFVPFGTGIVIVREGFKLRDALMTEQPPYLQDHNKCYEEAPIHLTFELTRPNRGLRVWLPLQFYGVGAFSASLTEKVQLTRYAYKTIKEIPGFIVDCPPQLTTFTFYYETGDCNSNEKFSTSIREKFCVDGTFFLASTRIHGEYRMKICFLHFRTHKDTIDDFIAMLTKIVGELKAD